MTSKNYRRSYDAERGLLARLQERGYWAERAHASKGTFDIVAVYPVETLLIRLN